MGRRRKKNRCACRQFPGATAGGPGAEMVPVPFFRRARRAFPGGRLGGRRVPGLSAGLAGRIHLGRRPHLLNNPVLRPGGLFRHLGARHVRQLLAVTFTAYWVQYQLWGLAPAGFHLVNIALHALSAILIWRILALLRVPGARVGGGPVCAAPGQRRERGLDHATEKHAVVGADAAFRAALFALGAASPFGWSERRPLGRRQDSCRAGTYSV